MVKRQAAPGSSGTCAHWAALWAGERAARQTDQQTAGAPDTERSGGTGNGRTGGRTGGREAYQRRATTAEEDDGRGGSRKRRLSSSFSNDSWDKPEEEKDYLRGRTHPPHASCCHSVNLHILQTNTLRHQLVYIWTDNITACRQNRRCSGGRRTAATVWTLRADVLTAGGAAIQQQRAAGPPPHLSGGCY